MKLVEMKCKNCGAKLKVDSEAKEAHCEFCGVDFKIDDEVQHHKFDDMEQSGYEFEKGRIRAQQESRAKSTSNNNYVPPHPQKKNNKTLWLVLAWIFLLPFTATYFIATSKKLEKKWKIIIIVVIWVLFIIIGITNSAQQKEDQKKKIIECYSEETYNKLDEIFGIDNINAYTTDSTTCDTFKIKDKEYDEIEITLDDNKELVSIKVRDEIKYSK